MEEIIVTEGMDTMEEIATTGPGKGAKIAGGIALAMGWGFLAYKFIVKPVAAKIKAKKAQQAAEDTVVYLEAEEDSDEN